MIWLVLGTFVVAALRFTVPGHGVSWPGTYEAFAHIWVGVLICLAWQRRKPMFRLMASPWPLRLLVTITVLEVVMSVVSKVQRG